MTLARYSLLQIFPNAMLTSAYAKNVSIFKYVLRAMLNSTAAEWEGCGFLTEVTTLVR